MICIFDFVFVFILKKGKSWPLVRMFMVQTTASPSHQVRNEKAFESKKKGRKSVV